MINPNKIESLEIKDNGDYFKAISFIESSSVVTSGTLKMIEEICRYEKMNFDKINKNWINR